MIGLAALLLLLTVAVGAVQVGDDRELVLKRLVIEDDEGRKRIVLGTRATGQASLTHFDRNGKMRIDASTFPDGLAVIQHYDANGKRRIGAATRRMARGPLVSPTQTARSSAASPDPSYPIFAATSIAMRWFFSA